MTVRVHISNQWFDELKSALQKQGGTKTVEGRKDSPTWTKTKRNDVWLLFNDNGDTLLVRVVDVRRYPNLRCMLEQEGLRHVLPGVASIEQGIAVYQQWSSAEELDAYGFLAIELALL